MDGNPLAGAVVVTAVLLAATAFGLWRRRRDGRIAAPADDRLAPELRAALGVAPAAVTLLQFSSAFCTPCRATRAVLAQVSREIDGVAHVEVDAESHLDAVRALGIWRTPTTLVLDHDARVAGRAGGVPTRAQVVAAVTALLPGGPR